MTPRPRPSMVRTAAWVGLGVLCALRALLAAAPLEPQTESLLSDLATYLLPMALSMAATAVAAARSRNSAEREFWALSSSALVCLLVVESHWTWYTAAVDFHGPPATAPIRLLYVVAAALLFRMVLAMTGFQVQSVARRMRFHVDVSAALVTLFALSYGHWALPAAYSLEPRIATAVQFAIYSVAGFSILLAVGLLGLGWKTYRWKSWERIVVLALGIFALGLLVTPLWWGDLMMTQEPSAPWITVFLGGGVYLFCIAAVYHVTADADELRLEPWPLALPWRSPVRMAYPVFIAAFLPFLGWQSIRLGSRVDAVPLVVATAMLALLLVARSWMTTIELAHHRLRAVTDELTGAYNERYLHRRLGELMGGTSAHAACLVLVEAVDLSRASDEYGRRAAEHGLRRVADSMVAQAPAGVEVFRLTGGQLAALLPETSEGVALRFAASVTVRASRPTGKEDGCPLSLFAGVAAFPTDALDPDGLLASAHSALRAARHCESGHVVLSRDSASSSCDELGVDLRALRETVRALAAAVDARDPATRNHSANCAELATSLARRAGLAEESVQLIGLAALVHDVGKIGVTDAVLSKEGPLTPAERRTIEQHPELGQRILEPANLGDIPVLVRHHHERWDGQGYPDGLTGESIPLESRIMAVCDAFETMTAGRPYRPAVDNADALREVARCAGTQFDPVLAREFIEMMEPHAVRQHGVGRASNAAEATGEVTA